MPRVYRAEPSQRFHRFPRCHNSRRMRLNSSPASIPRQSALHKFSFETVVPRLYAPTTRYIRDNRRVVLPYPSFVRVRVLLIRRRCSRGVFPRRRIHRAITLTPERPTNADIIAREPNGYRWRFEGTVPLAPLLSRIFSRSERNRRPLDVLEAILRERYCRPPTPRRTADTHNLIHRGGPR